MVRVHRIKSFLIWWRISPALSVTNFVPSLRKTLIASTLARACLVHELILHPQPVKQPSASERPGRSTRTRHRELYLVRESERVPEARHGRLSISGNLPSPTFNALGA